MKLVVGSSASLWITQVKSAISCLAQIFGFSSSSLDLSSYQVDMASDKQGFPILTSEEAVESCKSMFGVAMSVDDILRPSVRQPVTLDEVRHQIVINFFVRTIFLLRNRAGCLITLKHILFRVCLLRDFHVISSKSFSDSLIMHNIYVQYTVCYNTLIFFMYSVSTDETSLCHSAGKLWSSHWTVRTGAIFHIY